ncbi:hypothetical protein [Anabaena sp. CA = ATCC 33047]|uniref:hypothetical protein n=1 Tax=Anabaena sp. (strain CA / ATCC 33047) TaxID=52271 RepID=UPI00083273D8|nr:hypothetical protein [Anabaena sp. CA = ATCC 33047]
MKLFYTKLIELSYFLGVTLAPFFTIFPAMTKTIRKEIKNTFLPLEERSQEYLKIVGDHERIIYHNCPQLETLIKFQSLSMSIFAIIIGIVAIFTQPIFWLIKIFIFVLTLFLPGIIYWISYKTNKFIMEREYYIITNKNIHLVYHYNVTPKIISIELRDIRGESCDQVFGYGYSDSSTYSLGNINLEVSNKSYILYFMSKHNLLYKPETCRLVLRGISDYQTVYSKLKAATARQKKLRPIT